MLASRKTSLPYIALFFGILALSMSGMFIRWSSAPGPVTSFYRMGIAALLLAPVITLHIHRRGLPKLAWLVFPALGGLFTALDHAAWSTAIDLTRIANATLLNYLAPLWVALIAGLVWRERLSGRFWLGLLITLAGMAVVVGGDLLLAPGMTGGNLLAILSSLFYAGYFLVTQRGRTKLDALTYVFLLDFFAAFFLLLFNGVVGNPLVGFDRATWLIFLVAAIISQVGGYFSIAYALGHLPASLVSPTMLAQPVITALLAAVIFGELLAPAQWAGGIAAILGIYMVNASRAAG